MRRLSAVVVLLLLSNIALAAEPRRDVPKPWREQGRVVILRPSGPLTDADRAELAAKGIYIKQVMTRGRYLARVDENVRVDDARVVGIEPLTAEKKIHATALHEASRGATWAKLNVVFQPDVDFDDARDAVLAAGAALAQPFRTDFAPSHRIDVTLAPASLDALAADDRVLTIAAPRHLRVEADNADSAALSHVTELYSAPYNLSGAGVTVSLFELAEGQASHVEFGGRLTVHTPAGAGSFSDKQHATHVAGTIGAAGVNPAAKGMAPAVTIHQFCVTCGSADLAWLDAKEEQLTPLGVVADNNSWGFVLGWTTEAGLPVWTVPLGEVDLYGTYDLFYTSPIDEISNKKDILFVHSAGNDGTAPSFQDFFLHFHVNANLDTDTTKTWCYSQNGSGTDCPASSCTGGCETARHHDVLPFDTIGLTAAAKNVITVGALISSTTPPSIVPFSSRGPAKDGRVKPDVVARGFQVFSSIPTNTYGRSNGTSMSSPVVTGVAALLVEQWRKTFGGANPKPAQLKALILAGAEDLGNPGPDYTYGFGLVNAKNSVDLIIADAAAGNRIRNLSIAQGQTQEVALSLVQAQKLRVLLNWADPSITPVGNETIAEKALVNNLDLSIIDPLGNTIRPYVLDKTKVNDNATTGVNNVDNVEEVEIANASAGTYRVRISGTAVPQGPQTAVLVSSANFAPPCLDIQEANNSQETSYGNLVPGQSVSAALCSQSDVDFFKFVATKTGPVTVTVKTFDTAVRVTLTGTGISRTQDVAANTTAVLTADANSVPNAITLKFEPAGTVGADPRYTFTPQFGETNQKRRRSVR